jgi:hypothetical protein
MKTGFCNWHTWTEAQKVTLPMKLRQAARRANMQCVLGFTKVWLNGEPVNYRDARQVIGERLLAMGLKPE